MFFKIKLKHARELYWRATSVALALIIFILHYFYPNYFCLPPLWAYSTTILSHNQLHTHWSPLHILKPSYTVFLLSCNHLTFTNNFIAFTFFFLPLSTLIFSCRHVSSPDLNIQVHKHALSYWPLIKVFLIQFTSIWQMHLLTLTSLS